MRRWKTIRSAATSVVLLAATVAWATPQAEVEIQHDPIECWPTDQFLFVDSTFRPPTDVQTAKLYFRSSTHPDYYFVEMTLNRQGRGRAIVPKADPTTVGVVYYVELVTLGFSAFRSQEYTTSVSSGSDCKRREPETAFYTGQNPDISLGATRAGATPLAPGFQADGISRFISVSGFPGETAGAGGGISGKTIGILAGAGGGAGLAFALAGGGSSDATTTGLGGSTSVTTTAGSTTTVIGGATSTTTTAGGGGSSTTTVSGGSSTTTVTGGPSTTTTGGPSTTTTTGGPSTTTTTGGPSTTTTTGGSSTTTTAGGSSTTSTGSSSSSSSSSTSSSVASSSTTSAPANQADLSITKTDSKDPVAVGEVFDYFVTVTNNGPANVSTVGFEDPLPSGMNLQGNQGATCSFSGGLVRCALGSLNAGQAKQVRLIVTASAAGSFVNTASVLSSVPDPVAGNNSASQSTRVTSTLRAERSATVRVTYRSALEAGREDRGYIILNSNDFTQLNGASVRVITASGRGGENHLEAALETPIVGQAVWRFDFSGSEHFVPGSLRVDAGRVLAMEAHSVAFAVQDLSPIRLRFELAP